MCAVQLVAVQSSIILCCNSLFMCTYNSFQGTYSDSISLCCSVLDFTLQLVETGAEDNMLSSLLIFSLQYVLVNHEHWKYKLKHARWQVTLKVPFTGCFSLYLHFKQFYGFILYLDLLYMGLGNFRCYS